MALVRIQITRLLTCSKERRPDHHLNIEDWTFEADGLMSKRQMSGNNVKITEEERFYTEDMSEEELDKVHISDKHW